MSPHVLKMNEKRLPRRTMEAKRMRREDKPKKRLVQQIEDLGQKKRKFLNEVGSGSRQVIRSTVKEEE